MFIDLNYAILAYHQHVQSRLPSSLENSNVNVLMTRLIHRTDDSLRNGPSRLRR